MPISTLASAVYQLTTEREAILRTSDLSERRVGRHARTGPAAHTLGGGKRPGFGGPPRARAPRRAWVHQADQLL